MCMAISLGVAYVSLVTSVSTSCSLSTATKAAAVRPNSLLLVSIPLLQGFSWDFAKSNIPVVLLLSLCVVDLAVG